MNKLLVLTLILATIFFNCNGIKTKQDVLQASVLKYKDSLGNIEITTYFPKEYHEVETDTLLSNGFRIKIKNFTDMEHEVLHLSKQDSIIYKHYYRHVISEIDVYKNSSKIFSKTIDKPFLLKHNEALKDYLNTANLSNVWLNENHALSKEKISIYIMFGKPETDDYFLNEMVIDSNGAYAVKQIE